MFGGAYYLEKPDKYLSRLERRRFDVMAQCMTAKDAAQKLGISEGAMNNWTWKLRKRLEHERGHLNAVLAQQKRNELLKSVLSKKKPIEPEDEEDDGFE